jgi:hypothetical protein
MPLFENGASWDSDRLHAQKSSGARGLLFSFRRILLFCVQISSRETGSIFLSGAARTGRMGWIGRMGDRTDRTYVT